MPPVPPNTAHSRAVRWHFRWQGGEIAELQRMIDTSPAETLEDAAVKLRRLGAYIEQGQPARLLAGALSAVERAVAETADDSVQGGLLIAIL